MNLLVLILGALISLGGISIAATAHFKEKKSNKGYLVSAIGFVVMTFSMSFTIIQTGYTGVRTTFGQISKDTVANGFNLKIPLVQSIKTVNNKMQDVAFEEKIWSETSERNQLYLSGIIVTYKTNPEKSAWVYTNVSDYENNLVSQTLVGSAIKASCKELDSTDATNRSLIEPLALKYVQNSLDNKYGKDVVEVRKVVIDNITFDETYNQKITEKQNAQLDYEKQQITNKKAVEKAEADAKVKLTKTNSDAKAKLISSKADSDANKLVQKTLTKDILTKMFFEKWNGELPKVSGGSDSLIDISSFLGK